MPVGKHVAWKMTKAPTESIEMSWSAIEDNWEVFSGRIRKEWNALERSHLDEIAGQRDRLSEKLQQFYGISKDAADAQIDAFADRQSDWTAG